MFCFHISTQHAVPKWLYLQGVGGCQGAKASFEGQCLSGA